MSLFKSFALGVLACQCLIAHTGFAQDYQLHRIEDWNLSPLPKVNPHKGEFKVAFWNLLTPFASDSPNNAYSKYFWKNRSHMVVDLILRDSPDILGFCECNLLQADDLSQALEPQGYALVGYSSHSLMTIDEVREQFALGNEVWYSEFVGFIYRKDRMHLLEMQAHPLPMGERHRRILTEGRFLDTLTGKEIALFSSHFDHLSVSSIEESGKLEIELMRDLEEKQIPWISFGDRNWSFDEQGERFAQEYVQCDFIKEFRDDTLLGHFGPSGTFPGHLWLTGQPHPAVIQDSTGQEMIAASTIDVGYRSKKLVTALASYTLTGEFSEETYELLAEGVIGNLAERNFASDHFYVGGIYRVTPNWILNLEIE